MAVSGIDSTSSAAATFSAPGSERTPKKILDQQDFFKLLAAQFSAQDPLKPMEDTAFIAQMASFSSLEMMNQMSASITALGFQQSYLNAQTLLGKVVTVTEADGTSITGLASAITTSDDGSTRVTIDGVEYPAGSVVGVRLPEE